MESRTTEASVTALPVDGDDLASAAEAAANAVEAADAEQQRLDASLLRCSICGATSQDGRPILRFFPDANGRTLTKTMNQDICLHIFCGKTAGILSSVNRPELEILTKAGLKNKHGIGPEVNAALARTREAVHREPKQKEKQYFLVREFEAHLHSIRHVNSAPRAPVAPITSNGASYPAAPVTRPPPPVTTSIPVPRLTIAKGGPPPPPGTIPVVANGGPPPGAIPVANGGAPSAYALPTNTQTMKWLSKLEPGTTSLSAALPPTAVPVKAEAATGSSTPPVVASDASVAAAPPATAAAPSVAAASAVPIGSESSAPMTCIPAPKAKDPAAKVLPHKANVPRPTGEKTADGKIRCGCGGSHWPAGSPKGNNSWRTHYMTKKHQKWLESHGYMGPT